MDLDHYASVLGVDIEHLAARMGQRHDVILDESLGVAWRFPRTPAALVALDVSAARAQAAYDVGLPTPAVVAVIPGGLGTARMGLRLLAGTGMTAEMSEGLGPRARERLVDDLVALLRALRTASPVGWPASTTTWSERWSDLGARLRHEVVPLVASGQGRRRALNDIGAAEAAAASLAAATGLVHGDLGGENVVLDPVSGHITGVLDWDDAAPGDPAVDLAAVLAHARPWLADGLMRADPSLLDLERRALAYTGTFALQQALWGLESDDAESVTDGLARYRPKSSSSTDASSSTSTS